MKYSIWEKWMLFSLIALCALVVIGMMDGSKEWFPTWPYFFTGSFLNLVICLTYGQIKNVQ